MENRKFSSLKKYLISLALLGLLNTQSFADAPNLGGEGVYCPTKQAVVGWQYSGANDFSDTEKNKWNIFNAASPKVVATPSLINTDFNAAYPNDYELSTNSKVCGASAVGTVSNSPSSYETRTSLSWKTNAETTCRNPSSTYYSIFWKPTCAFISQTQTLGNNLSTYCPSNQEIIGWQYSSLEGTDTSEISKWNIYTAENADQTPTPASFHAKVLQEYPYHYQLTSTKKSCGTSDLSTTGSPGSLSFSMRVGISTRSNNNNLCTSPSSSTSILYMKPTCKSVQQTQTYASEAASVYCPSGILQGWRVTSSNLNNTAEDSKWTVYTSTSPMSLKNPGEVQDYIRSIYNYGYPIKSGVKSCGTTGINKYSGSSYSVGISKRDNNDNFCDNPSNNSNYISIAPVCATEKFFPDDPPPQQPCLDCEKSKENTPPVIQTPSPPNMHGNPIDVITGQKMQTEVDYAGKTLNFTRTYLSQSAYSKMFKPSLSEGWHHNYEYKLYSEYDVDRYDYQNPKTPLYNSKSSACTTGWDVLKVKKAGFSNTTAKYNNNVCEIFSGSTKVTTIKINSTNIGTVAKQAVYAIRPNGASIKFTVSGNQYVPPSDQDASLTESSGIFTLTINNNKEYYNADGRITNIDYLGDKSLSFVYSGGFLSEVKDEVNRKITFAYSGNKLSSITNPANEVYSYAYDTNNQLSTITYPNSTYKQYVYEISTKPYLLTGIIDESFTRFATWDYDSDGKAILSKHAGNKEQNTFSYTTTSTTKTDPLGKTTVFNLTTTGSGKKQISSMVNSCTNCSTQTTTYTYDPNGYLSSLTDPNGNIFYYTLNSRGQQTAQTLASGSSVARSISATWDTTFKLPSSVTNGNQYQAWTYDSNGNLASSTITDLVSSKTYTTSFTYNNKDLLTSINGPRTDLNDITTITYDSQNNISTITNPLNQVTVINSYDVHGNPTQLTAPNGLITTLSYDNLQRVTSQNVGGLVTSYTYDPRNLLSTITLPSGEVRTLTYDSAQRLIGVSTNNNHALEITLDNDSNITQEIIKTNSVTKRSMTKTYNALGNLINITGGNSQSQDLVYDLNDNLTSIDDNGDTSTQEFDALNRVKKITNALNQSAEYTYNNLDQLTSVKDLKGNTTTYTINPLNEVTNLVSPDTGTASYTYDSAGNVASKTDNKNQTENYVYDALNRLISKTNNDGTTYYTYDTGSTSNIGQLVALNNPVSTIALSYDTLGRLLSKTDTVLSGVGSQGNSGNALSSNFSKTLQYQYNSSTGLTTKQILPSGAEIGFSYSNGELTNITKDSSALLSSLEHEAFGDVVDGTFFNSENLSRGFDLSGRLTNISTGSISYDLKNNLSNFTEGGISAGTSSKDYNYDEKNQLLSYVDDLSTISYVYDLNGNRTEQAVSTYNPINSTTTTNTTLYSIDGSSNKLSSYNFNGGSSVNLTYDVNSNVTYDGINTLSYNADNSLTSLSKSINGFSLLANYYYNPMRQRVYKEVEYNDTTNTTQGNDNNNLYNQQLFFMYDEDGKVVGQYDLTGNSSYVSSNTYETIYMGSMPIAILSEGNLYAIHSDNLNTPRQINDVGGNTVWNWSQYTFGSSNADVNGLNISNRFPGQNTNIESGFSQNWHREYNPNTGRYLQSDPIGLAGGLNTFSYVGNNPLNYSDQMGLYCKATGNRVYCEPANGLGFDIPREVGWPDYINGANENYHIYNKPFPIGNANKKCVMQGIINNPTPGNPNPASVKGTWNDASPTGFNAPSILGTLGYISKQVPETSPVKTYLFNNGIRQFVVNVTLPGHPLFPGYVMREVSNGVINNWGEGLNERQNTPILKDIINSVWKENSINIINKCGCSQ